MPSLSASDWLLALVQFFGGLTALFNLATAYEANKQLKKGPSPELGQALAALKAASASNTTTLRVIGDMAEHQNKRFAQSQTQYRSLESKIDQLIALV